MAGTAISYNSNSLQTDNIITSDISHESSPTIDAKPMALSHTSQSRIPYVSYPSKEITISGKVTGSSVADLDSKLDTFRGYLVGKDKNLDIAYAGSTRRYIATPTAVRIDRPGGLSFANFQVTFLCSQPFGQATSDNTVLSATGRTSSSYNDSYSFPGSAPEQRPKWTITLTALTGGTDKYIAVGNNATGEQIKITRTWATNDVVEIDSANKTVKVNGTEVDFEGAFPLFGNGSQTLTYLDNLTTRTFNITVVNTPLYL